MTDEERAELKTVIRDVVLDVLVELDLVCHRCRGTGKVQTRDGMDSCRHCEGTGRP